ncbi:Inner membrane protein YhaH [Acinetobacter calcoaceticus]|nr:Inner membrane protein YhaH [Acinetobacter calcoaceticus]
MNSPFENQPIQQDSPFKASGRFGRLSYAAWTFIIGLIAFTLAFSSMLWFPSSPSDMESSNATTLGMILLIIIYIVFGYFNFVFSIRRLHDCDNTGWLSLLLLVPVVNIIFIIYLFGASGTEGTNDYGPERPTPGWERVLGWIYIILIPLAFVFAIVATIMAPTYKGYVEKSESAVIGTNSHSQ